MRSLGQYDDEDAAYVAYRRELAKYELYEKGYTNSWNRKFLQNKGWYWIRHFCTDFIGKYGTDPFSVVLAIVINITLFGVLYAFIDFLWPSALAGDTIIHAPYSYFYFSAITSFTVGFGDLHPNNVGIAILTCLESFIGVFLMSYFVVAFSRKVLR